MIEVPVQHVAITFDNGEMRVMAFALAGHGNVVPYGATFDEKAGRWERPATDATIFEEIMRAKWEAPDASGAYVPILPVKWRAIDWSEPAGHEAYRGCRVDDGKDVMYDITRARDVRRDQLRRERAPLLAQLDIDVIRAQTESKDAKAVEDAVAEKQRLRDITADPRIEAATTIEELKAVTL